MKSEFTCPVLIAVSLMVFSLTLNGCNSNSTQYDPDDYRKHNKVYMGQARNNPVEKHILIGESASIEYNAAFAGAEDPTRDIMAQFSINSALVDTFNANNSTSYPILSNEGYTMGQTEAVIHAGKRRSEKQEITIKSSANIEPGTKYLLPVTMSVDTTEISLINEWKTTYFLIRGEYTKVYLPSAESNPVEHTLNPGADSPQAITYSAAYKGVEGIESSQKPKKDISVKFEVDPAFVDSFNIKNSTDYAALPEESYQLGQADATIKAGEENTGEFKIDLENKNVNVGEKYLLPLRLYLAGNNQTVRVDKQLQTVYYLIDVSYDMLDRSDWSVLAQSSHQPGFSAELMFDGDTKSHYNSGYKIPDSDPSRPPFPHTISVDMGEVNTIHGFKILGNTKQHLEQNPKEVTFQFSDNGEDWRDGEDFTLPISLEETKANAILSKSVEARYFKFTIRSSVGDPKITTVAELYAF